MVAKKQTVDQALVDGYFSMLKNTTKPGDPGKHSGKYRTDVLNSLKDRNEPLYNAVIKRLGDK